jgi:hypothetical protein
MQLALPLGAPLEARARQAVVLPCDDEDEQVGEGRHAMTIAEARRILHAHIDAELCDYDPCKAWVSSLCGLIETANHARLRR